MQSYGAATDKLRRYDTLLPHILGILNVLRKNVRKTVFTGERELLRLVEMNGRQSLSGVLGYLPITVVGFAALTGWLHASGVEYYPDGYVFVDLFNPLVYVGSLFFHADWTHYWGNMAFLLPFGVLLTWLTSNRHVLVVMVVSHFAASVAIMAAFLTMGLPVFGVGSSLAVFSVIGAAVVAGAGTLRDRKGMSDKVVGVTLALLTVFYLVNVLLHMGHAFGLLFGAVLESFYVLGGDDEEMDFVEDEYTPVIER